MKSGWIVFNRPHFDKARQCWVVEERTASSKQITIHEYPTQAEAHAAYVAMLKRVLSF